jgi:2-polyprenyl-6-hydroxyphenyl methylase/3-demethylubiquinone-9 3-methyltransferase
MSTDQVAAAITVPNAPDIASGERFGFGENWASFLSVLDEERIAAAERGLQSMLRCDRLDGMRFLDIGSGSGLSSLAAHRLGATVHSFDYDPRSVACTSALRQKYRSGRSEWVVERGSVLDEDYLTTLGSFDIVYSWGVLHHTGDMWRALANAAIPVGRDGGRLFVAIYNDAGSRSRRWHAIKRTYNGLPKTVRPAFALLAMLPDELKAFGRSVLALRPRDYIRSWTEYRRRRGMNRWHDIVDWVGGYPYEYATAHDIFDFYRTRGFTLAALRCDSGGLGCNQFVFERRVER